MSIFTTPLQAFAAAHPLTAHTSTETARDQFYGELKFSQSEAAVLANRTMLGYIRSYACELYGFPMESVDDFVVMSIGAANPDNIKINVSLEEFKANLEANQNNQALIDLISADADKCFALYCLPHPDGGWGYLKFAGTSDAMSFGMTIAVRM